MVILYHHRTRALDGQSVHIAEIIGALHRLGHVVVVVGPRQHDAMKASSSRAWLPRPLYELLEFGYSFIEFGRLCLAIRQHHPDAVYERSNVFMLSGVWACRCSRLPLLLEVNAPLTDERAAHGGLALRRLADWSERLAWRSASCVLAVTQVLADRVIQSSVSPERVRVVPNGVDQARFIGLDPVASRRAFGLADELVLGFVGFVRPWHGLDHVIELIAQEPVLRGAHFLIVGDGPACAGLRAHARARGVSERLTITGVVPPSGVAHGLGAIDIALQPDVTPYASPLKLFEYMAAECAIVAPDTPNIREILEDESDALLFRQGNAEAFAGCVVRLALSAPLRARLGGLAAKKISERGLTWEANARRLVGEVEKLTSTVRRATPIHH